MPYEYIDTQEIGGVLVITMDDARTRNAIGDEWRLRSMRR